MDNNLAIGSATGVDLHLNIAGPGARSYAFVIDWHFRVLLALAWFCAASLLYIGTLSVMDTQDSRFTQYFLIALLPALVIYNFYHPVLEILMQGRSPGKRIAGVRIVTLDGNTPGVLAHIVRNLLRLFDSLPAAYAIGLVTTVMTRNAVRVGDIAAGTVLIYDSDIRGHSAVAAQRLHDAGRKYGLENAELLQDLIDRWEELEEPRRVDLGQRMLARLEPDLVPAGTDNGLLQQLKTLLQPTGTP